LIQAPHLTRIIPKILVSFTGNQSNNLSENQMTEEEATC
jgi:hypothetical protein